MNAIEYDTRIQNIEEATHLIKTSRETFCEYVEEKLVELNMASKLFNSAIINEFKQKMLENLVDNRTLELARTIVRVLQAQIDMEFEAIERQYKNEIRNQITSLKLKERTFSIIQRSLQFIIIVGATSVPLILNISDIPKIIPSVTSIIVAVATALITYFKLGNLIHYYRQSAQKMQQEYSLYTSRRKHYSNLRVGATLNLFMDKIDELRHEQNKLSLELERASQSHEQKIEGLVKTHNQ